MNVLSCIAISALIVFPIQQAQATVDYSIATVGTFGGQFSQVYGINSNGAATGYSDYRDVGSGDIRHAFVWEGSTLNDIGSLNGRSSVGLGINDAGQITGSGPTVYYGMGGGTGPTHAFLYSNGVIADIGTLGGSVSVGSGINNSGQIAGASYVAGDTMLHAFRYHNGLMVDIGTLGGVYSYGYGINDSGQVTGDSQNLNGEFHAFIWQEGGMIDLGTLGGEWSSGTSINAFGQVTGVSVGVDGIQHAFLYSSGHMTDLGTLGGTLCSGLGINASAQVVGSCLTTGNHSRHAFATVGQTMADLNDLIDPLSGWVLEYATAINDAGQIAGFGSINGLQRGFVLTPTASVPEPATWSLMILGFGMVGHATRRHRRSDKAGRPARRVTG